ncbi:MAG: serine/threonine-protein kinase [Myxococcota bacterium]
MADRYRVRRCLSRGGMGVVYLASQEPLDREVVVKVVRSDLEDPETQARFRREARSLSMLSHPNVVQIHDYGFDPTAGLYFIVMEYARGVTLARYRRERGGRLPLAEVRPILTQVLSAVAEAHRAGLVHRDLKPSNVVLTAPEGARLAVKLLDFGLSKLTFGDEPITRADTFAGSALYMAPELVRAQTPGPQADVYALGVLAYQLLSGANPVRGEHADQILAQQLAGESRPLAEVLPPDVALPPALVALVDRCTSLEPERRPPDAATLLEAFLAATAGVQDAPANAIAAAADASEPRSASLVPAPNRSGTGMTVLTHPSGPLRRPPPRRLWGALMAVTVALVLVAVPTSGVLAALAFRWLDSAAAPPVAAPAPAPVDADAAAVVVLRDGALRALRDADYDRAMDLVTEAVSIAPADGELKQLLQVAGDLRDRGPAGPAGPGGVVIVMSSPPGVTFAIPGVGRGETPQRVVGVPPGEQRVEFYVDGTLVRTEPVAVDAAEARIVDVDVRTAPRHASPHPVDPPIRQGER